MLWTNQRPSQFNALAVHINDLKYLWYLTAVHVLHQLHLLFNHTDNKITHFPAKFPFILQKSHEYIVY